MTLAAVYGAGLGLSLSLFIWLAFKFAGAAKMSQGFHKYDRLRKLSDLAGPASLLIAPLTNAYDLAVCAAPLAKYVRLPDDKAVTLFILFSAGMSVTTARYQWAVINPHFYFVAGVFWFLLLKLEKGLANAEPETASR